MKPTLLTPYECAELWSNVGMAVARASRAAAKQDRVPLYLALDDLNGYANQLRADAAAQVIEEGKKVLAGK
jgi:hypothetical protein